MQHNSRVVGKPEVMDMRIDRQVGLLNLIKNHTFEHRMDPDPMQNWWIAMRCSVRLRNVQPGA